MHPKISVIIPVKKINDYIRRENIPALLGQSFKSFEVIILPDRETSEDLGEQVRIIASWPKTGPADKRDMGAGRARGEILAFIDDDAYPARDWLENAWEIFQESDDIAAVGGPNITPDADNIRQRASGWVWSTWLGCGGAGAYRCRRGKRRDVDDFPTVNLLVRKKDFEAVSGFDSHYWPGEDTKFCLDIVKKLNKRIVYSPRVVVYHHRREVFGPHLAQIGRYAVHRGNFARVLPETSLRLGYFVPSMFLAGLILGPAIIYFVPLLKWFYFLAIGVYGLLLWHTGFRIWLAEKNLKLAFLSITAIFATHVYYGFLFVVGFLKHKLRT